MPSFDLLVALPSERIGPNAPWTECPYRFHTRQIPSSVGIQWEFPEKIFQLAISAEICAKQDTQVF